MSVIPAGGFSDARRGGAAWFLLLAILCGLVVAWLAMRAVSAARREVPVVMARREVPPLTRIRSGDVVVADVPAAALPPGALHAVAAAQGDFTRMGLVPGEIVTGAALEGGVTTASALDVRLAGLAETALCPRGTSAAPAPAAPAGAGTVAGSPRGGAGCLRLVAMSVPVSADQGFQMVHTGDTVDVVAGYGVRSGTVSQVVAADVPVLDRVAAGQGGVPGSGSASGWLVLGVSPGQALRLQLALTTGKLAVLLEPPGAPPEPPSLDARIMDTSGLAGGGGAAAPTVAGVLPGVGGG